MDWGITGYVPEKVVEVSGFKPLKGKFDCFVTKACVEEYDGDYEDYKGKEFIRYELQIANGQDNAGRKFFKRIDPEDEKVNKKGKTKYKQFMDAMFTLGLEFKDRETLEQTLEKFSQMSVKVSAYFFTPDDKDEPIQMHNITGIAELEAEYSSDIPF